MRPTRRAAFVLAVSSLLAAAAPAQGAAPTLQGAARADFLREIEQRMSSVRSIAARFDQRKVLALFDDDATSRGLILFARPDRLRWEIREPFRSLLIVHGDRVAKFDYGGGERRALELGRARDVLLVVMSQIRGWFRGRFEQGDEYLIDVQREPDPRIVLRPKADALRSTLRAIEVDLRPDLRSVSRVTIREQGDDFTEMTFTELRRDAELPATWFDPDDPAEIDGSELDLGGELGLGSETSAAPAATVATHYFYWYRYPDEHFGAGGGEGHTHAFVEPERVSYLDPDWHEGELAAMAACGIDAALPVYWGAPGHYERPNLAFSRLGLPPMVAALDRLAERGAPRVRLGLFYDTSTLWNAVRGVEPAAAKVDLTTPSGRDVFCRTVVEYFEVIPERHWARHRGGPLVVTYVSAFAARWDATLGDALRAAFAARFPGERPCLVFDASWGEAGQDLTTSWGAALHGPRLFAGVAQLGPGYDDSPVPGRTTPIREREDGAFYAWSWRQAVASRPELVLIETWNEMHEGTEICATAPTGTRYLDLTKAWIDRLRRGDPGPELAIAHARPRPRPDRSWGEDAAGAAAVHVRYERPQSRLGLREIPLEDGAIGRSKGPDGRGALRSQPTPGLRYVYFQVADAWCFDVRRDLELVVAWSPTGGGVELGAQFDSHDRSATLEGSYTDAARTGGEVKGELHVDRFALPAARLANRQNGGCDLRLVLRGGGVDLFRVEVRVPERRGGG